MSVICKIVIYLFNCDTYVNKQRRDSMECRFCGEPVRGNNDFCSCCGNSLKGNVVQSKPTYSATKVNSQNRYHHTMLDKVMVILANLTFFLFLFFNIKMAPFRGIMKIVAYLIEAFMALYLLNHVKENVADCSSKAKKICAIVMSLMVIFLSVGFRITYEIKRDKAESIMPDSGKILVEIDRRVDYSISDSVYGTQKTTIRNPKNNVTIDGASGSARITLGKPFALVVECKGNGGTDTAVEHITLYASDFNDGGFVKTYVLQLGIVDISVKVSLKRVCTFWEVVFY